METREIRFNDTIDRDQFRAQCKTIHIDMCATNVCTVSISFRFRRIRIAVLFCFCFYVIRALAYHEGERYIYLYSFVSIWNTIKNEVINVASECSRSLEVAFDALDFNCVCASALARSLHADAVDFETICIAFAGENVTKSKYQNRSYRLRRLALE